MKYPLVIFLAIMLSSCTTYQMFDQYVWPVLKTERIYVHPTAYDHFGHTQCTPHFHCVDAHLAR